MFSLVDTYYPTVLLADTVCTHSHALLLLVQLTKLVTTAHEQCAMTRGSCWKHNFCQFERGVLHLLPTLAGLAGSHRCVVLARDVSLVLRSWPEMFPSASQAVPPGQRGRVLGDVESVVSGVSPLVQTKLLFTSHRIIIERDPRDNSRNDISVFRMI